MNDLKDFYRNITYCEEYDENSFIGKWLDYGEWAECDGSALGLSPQRCLVCDSKRKSGSGIRQEKSGTSDRRGGSLVDHQTG